MFWPVKNACLFGVREREGGILSLRNFTLHRDKTVENIGFVQPIHCTYDDILFCFSCRNVSSTQRAILYHVDFSSLGGDSSNILVFGKKCVFQKPKNFDISANLHAKLNMAYSTLGYPYFMFFVHMEKVDRELSLNTEIRKVLKRSKRPLKRRNVFYMH